MNRGVKGSEAGRALSAVLINLTTGSGEAGEALETLGVKAFDSNGAFVGLETVFNDLSKALSECTEEEKNNYLAMIGGKEHVSDLNALMDGLSNEYDELKTSVSGASGTLEKMTEQMGSTTAMNIEELKGKLESLAITTGNELLPSFNNVVDGATNVVEWFSDLDQGTKDLVVNMALAVPATNLLLEGFSKLTSAGSSLFDCMGGLAKTIGESGGVASALGGLGSTLGTVLGVGGAVAIGTATVVGLAKAFQTVYEVSKWSSESVMTNSEYLRMIEEPAGQAKIALENLAKTFEEAFQKSSAILQNVVDTNKALTEQNYQQTINSYQQTHNDVITQLENRRTAEKAIIEQMYADELLDAQLFGQEAVQEVQNRKQAEIDAINSRIDEMVNIENTGYQRVLADAKMAQEERYATDTEFQSLMMAGVQQYYDNVSILTETGEAHQQQVVAENQSTMVELRRQFENDFTSGASEMYNKIQTLARTNADQERAIEDEKYAGLIEQFGAYNESWFASVGTSKEAYMNFLKAEHEEELNAIEQRYSDELTQLDEANSRRQEKINLAGMAEQEIRINNYDLTEQETAKLYEKMYEIYDKGEKDNGKIIETALKEILKKRKKSNETAETDLETHGTNMTNTIKSTWESALSETISGVEGINEEIDKLQDKEITIKVNFESSGYNNVNSQINSVNSSTPRALNVTECLTPSIQTHEPILNRSLEINEISPLATSSNEVSDMLNSAITSYDISTGKSGHSDFMSETEMWLKRIAQLQQQALQQPRINVNVDNMTIGNSETEDSANMQMIKFFSTL